VGLEIWHYCQCAVKQRTFEKMNRLAYLVLVENIIERLEVDLF